MTASLSIGEFSRATHLSVKTLRHYHEVGLLEPAHTDVSSGHRYYRPDQIGTAQIIRRLRELDMPVERVKGVVNATDPRAPQALIVGHLEQMEAQLGRRAATVTALRTLLQEPETAAAISYRTAPATWALTISAVVTLDELVAWSMAAFHELSETLASAGIRPAGSRGALYAQDIFERERGEVVVFIPVVRSAPGAGRAQSVLLPDTELAVTVHHGDHNNVDRTYGVLGRHVADRALRVSPPVREYYIVGSEHTDNRRQWQTEIAWPIQRTPSHSSANKPKGDDVTSDPQRTVKGQSDTVSRPGRLAGKVVLLTGIGGGQGRAAAMLFAREEALVVGCDVDADTAAETVALAQADGLDIASMAPVDLADPVAARRWVEAGVRVHGRIDVVYNNASRPAIAPFPEISLEEYRYTVANEIDLVWHVCQASWSHLAASKGVIINTASIAGLIGTRDLKQAAHVLAKGGIIALTRQLAAEGAEHGIRANSISPGVIATPSVQAQIDLLGDDAPMMSMVRTTADGRPGQPEDIAYAALFLASDEARFVNGENLVVDGGATVILG